MLIGMLMLGITTPTHAQICPEEAAKLLANDATASDNFGRSVSISGDTAIIGASQNDNGSNTNPGSAYVFTRSGGVWTQQTKLFAFDATVGDGFGYSVSISGDMAVIGAYGDDDNGSSSGSAYVFENIGGVWMQRAKLLPTDGAAYDRFGRSVSISGDTIVVSSYWDEDNGSGSGSAYIFEKTGILWMQQAKLLASDGAAYKLFGSSVSISGDTAVIGAYGNDDNGFNSGSAYIFEKVGGVWTQQAKRLASDGTAGDGFGYSVSINGDTAVIGAHGNDDNGSSSGSAYIFEKVGGVWTQQAKLLASDGAAYKFFGSSVSISGDTAVIGAYGNDDNGFNSGSAYIFEKVGGVWTQQAKLLASDGAAGDRFGSSVSISGNTTVIGALWDNDNGTDSGSAYIFDLGCSISCLADFNDDGVLDIFDVFAFLDAYNATDPLADLTGDGVIDIFDVFAFLDAYNTGCP